MPTYEYNGHQFSSDHPLSDAEWKQTLAYFDSISTPKEQPKEETSAVKAFGKSAVEGTIPAAGGMAGFKTGAELGFAVTPPVLPVVGPLAKPAGALVGGLAGAFGGSYLAEQGQEALGKFIPESLKEPLGFGKEQRAQETKEHPYASFAGTLAPNLAFFRPGAIEPIVNQAGKTVLSPTAQRILMGGAGAGIEAGTEYATEGTIDPTKVAMAGAFQSFAAKPTKLGEKFTPKIGSHLNEDLSSTRTMDAGDQALVDTHIQMLKEDRQKTADRLASIDRDRVTGEVPPEMLEQSVRLQADLDRIDARLEALMPKTEGKVAGEMPPKTDVEVPRSNEQVDANGIPLVKENEPPLRMDYNEEGAPEFRVRSDSDVPPDLQALDQNIGRSSEFVPEKTIETESRSSVETRHSELNRLIEDTQDALDRTYDRINATTDTETRSFGESSNINDFRNNPYDLNVLQRQAEKFEEKLDRLTAERDSIVRSRSNPAKESIHVINDVLNDSNISAKQKPFEIAKRLASNYGDTQGHIHYVGSETLRKTIVDTVVSLNKVTGQKDKIIVVHAPAASKGSFHAVGNTAVLFVSDVRSEWFSKFAKMFNRENFSKANLIHNIGHEYGHYYHAKLVQAYGNDAPLLKQLMVGFDKFSSTEGLDKLRTIASIPMPEKIDGANYTRLAKHFDSFPEYFAEAFNRAILSGKLPENRYLAEVYTGLRNIGRDVWDKLRQFGFTVSRDDFTTQFINESLHTNRAFIVASGKTMDDARVRSLIDDKLSRKPQVQTLQEANESIERYFKTNSANDYVPVNTEQVVAEQKKLDDCNWLSGKALVNFFGNDSVRLSLEHIPLIKAVTQAITNADFLSQQIGKRLLHGVVEKGEWLKKHTKGGFVFSLKQIENKNSLKWLLENGSDLDWYKTKTMLERGMREGLDHAETLQKYGSELTESQTTMFKAMADYANNKWKMANEAGLNLPRRKGHFPAVRTGEFSVIVERNGERLHREHVRTEAEAKRIRNELKKSGKWNNSDIIVEKNLDTRLETEQRDQIVDIMLSELKQKGEISSVDTLEDLLDRLSSKPKLGKHHEQRTNLTGYKGSELTYTEAERGRSFKEAITTDSQEFQQTMRKIYISRETNPLIKTPNGLDESHPNAFYSAKTLVEVATNKTESSLKPFDDAIHKVFDAGFFKLFGKESKISTYEHLSGLGTRLFYITTLTNKAAFWAGQILSSPLAMRQIFREANVIDGMVSAGKGTLRMLNHNEESLACVHWLSQNTETFHPSLTNELNKLDLPRLLKEGTLSKRIVDILTGEAPSSAADSFSRYWTSMMMFEHYKSLGFKGEDLYRKVAQSTDSTMVRYGKRYRAPYIQKLGIIGEAMAPLHTFTQAQWGNFVADVMLAKRTGNVAPLVATFLVSVMMGGVIGGPLIAEYEFIRRVFGLEETLPSPIDWALKSGNPAISHGLITAGTGFDIGSTMRSSPLIAGMSLADSSLLDMFPAIKFYGSQLGNIVTATKHKLGGDVSEAKHRTAILGLTPKGVVSGMVDDLRFNATDRKMVPTSSGAGLVKQTGKERAATYLGTRTYEASSASMKYNRLTMEQKRKQTEIKNQIDILGDAVNSNNSFKKEKALRRLKELEVTSDSVQNQLIGNLSGRQRGILERFVLGNKGMSLGVEGAKRARDLMEYMQ